MMGYDEIAEALEERIRAEGPDALRVILHELGGQLFGMEMTGFPLDARCKLMEAAPRDLRLLVAKRAFIPKKEKTP